MRDEPPTVRGALLLGVQSWLSSELSVTQFEAFTASLIPEDAAIVSDRSVINQSRIPAEQFGRITERMIDRWGLEGPRGFHSIAGHIAIADLKGYMKVLLHLGTPKFVLHRFPKVWHHYFSHGEVTVTELGGNVFRVNLSGAAIYGAGAVEGNVGWMRAALEYSGAKSVKVAKAQPVDPNDVVFQISWI